MLRALKRVLGGQESAQLLPARERRQLQIAADVLVHEARRADYDEDDNQETDAGSLPWATPSASSAPRPASSSPRDAREPSISRASMRPSP